MRNDATFRTRAAANFDKLSPAERQVARFFQENREQVLVASAAELAQRIGTSDATVIRAVKALGFSGLDALRRQLAAELRINLSPAARLARTLGSVEDGEETPFGATLRTHIQSLERLRDEISPELFAAAIKTIVQGTRVFVFGIGPSSAVANYLVIQLDRFGFDANSLTDSGLLLADGLHRLRKGDVVVILAYSRVYPELDVLLQRSADLVLPTILLTDTLGGVLRRRVDITLPVPRGIADGFSTHTATLGLIECLLVGIAASRPADTVSHLKELNRLRAALAGDDMKLEIARPKE
jgi:DNA-binding MurR/RpiR family transcriptional regulator